MRKLIMLILIGMMSYNSFSQNVIDSTSIQLKKPIVRLVIKDLIIGDSFKKELSLKGSQLEFTKQLNDKLRLEIKKQRIKNKILGGAGLVAIGGVILILK